MFKHIKNRFLKFSDNPKAVFPFLLKRIYYNFVADAYLKEYRDFKSLSPQETLDKVITEDLSLIRFGDGSFDMIMGFSIYFNGWRQKYDKVLAERLQEIMLSHDKKVLISYTVDFILKPKVWFKERNEEIGWYSWVFSKILLRKFYRKDVTYGNSLCFYPKYNDNIDYAKLKSFFSKKDIIVVASSTASLSDLSLGKRTFLVESPGSDAWQSYDNVKQRLVSLIEENNLTRDNTLVLISMAEAAKVLVYDLHLEGYRGWDTGQFFEMASKEIRKLSSIS